jgi:hypothetical protein
VAREAEQHYGALRPFTAEEVGTLVGAGFVGAESLLLLGFDREALPVRSAVRRFSAVIREFEEGQAATRE